MRQLLLEFKDTDLGYLPSGMSYYNLLKSKYPKWNNTNIQDTENEILSVNKIESSIDSTENKILRIKNLFNRDSMLNMNALVAILRSIPDTDILTLQEGVNTASQYYRYYQYNSTYGTTVDDIPTSTHRFPDGGAIDLLTQVLSLRKKKGVIKVDNECQKERMQKHKYIGNFPCDRPPKKKPQPAVQKKAKAPKYR